MVLYLGYAALVLIGLYFIFGILQISGEGLAKLGYPNNFIREGFSDTEQEDFEKKAKGRLKAMDVLNKMTDENKKKVNFVNDIPEYGDVIDSMKAYYENLIRAQLVDKIINNKLTDKDLEPILKEKTRLDLLNEYTL